MIWLRAAASGALAFETFILLYSSSTYYLLVDLFPSHVLYSF